MKPSLGTQKREAESYSIRNTIEVEIKPRRGCAKADWVVVIVARDRQDNTFDKCLDS
jgi:ribosomal protein S7